MTTEKGQINQPVEEENIYIASQWELMFARFKQHKLAVFAGVILISFYVVILFADFIIPYPPTVYDAKKTFVPPQGIHFIDQEGKLYLRPFVYKVEREFDQSIMAYRYTINKNTTVPIRFFIRGYRYKLLGLFDSDIHLFGVPEEDDIFLFGTDKLGRDVFSRSIYAARISLSIGLIGVFISFILGIIIGGFSGYYGGVLDTFIQRVIEFIRSIPTIPLWLSLSAALPAEWTSLQVYFAITLILSLRGWTNLARVVRGKFLSLRKEDFIIASKISGTSEFEIITSHLLPSILSHIIAAMTLAVPRMILGETALSFLGVGLRPPTISWGVLLKQAQDVNKVANAPWILIPGLLVVIAVLSFNFLGDGMRDAADPYSQL